MASEDKRLRRRFARELNKLERVLMPGDLQRARSRARRLVEEATAAGHGEFASKAETLLARFLIDREMNDRARVIEEAVALLRSALSRPMLPYDEAVAHGSLATALGQRIHGDRRDNQEDAIVEFERSLALHEALEASDERAMTQTNLAQLLLERESGDPSQNRRRAAALCEAALEYRNPGRDPTNWAYTMVNLGAAQQGLARTAALPLETAAATYQLVVDRRAEIHDPRVLAQACLNLAGILLRQAGVLPIGSEDEDEPDSNAINLAVHGQVIAQAAEYATLAASSPYLLTRGRALVFLARGLRALGDAAGATAAAKSATELLTADTAPREGRASASLLAGLLLEQGEWRQAAIAYEKAVDASDAEFDSRIRASDRQVEIASSERISRWCSYAWARAGECERAFIAFERGRARELRRRIVDPAALSELATEDVSLHAAYMDAARAVASADLGDASDAAQRDLQTVSNEIRMRDGFADFGWRFAELDLQEVVADGTPLACVNPTPGGTMVVVLYRSGGAVAAHCLALDLTGHELMELVALGGPSHSEPSFLAAVTGGPVDLEHALDYLLPEVGERLVRPLAEFLDSIGASGVTLLTTGFAIPVPLHAASWQVDGGSRCLLDDFTVRYAPSAAIHATCLARATAHPQDDLYLVGLATPRAQPPIPSSRGELSHVATLFGDREVVAYDEEATTEFLFSHSASCSHLHLACHAAGSAFSFADSRLELWDRDLGLFELAALGGLSARLVVASACETAVQQLHMVMDEAFSTAAVLIAAGAAGVVASQWKVNDRASALLMSRFYEHHLGDQMLDPAKALRESALWLRDLTEGDEDAFIRARPDLGVHLGPRPPKPADGSVRFYKQPRYWAAFALYGA